MLLVDWRERRLNAHIQAVGHWAQPVDIRWVGAAGMEKVASDWQPKVGKHMWEVAFLDQVYPADCLRVVFRYL